MHVYKMFIIESLKLFVTYCNASLTSVLSHVFHIDELFNFQVWNESCAKETSILPHGQKLSWSMEKEKVIMNLFYHLSRLL